MHCQRVKGCMPVMDSPMEATSTLMESCNSEQPLKYLKPLTALWRSGSSSSKDCWKHFPTAVAELAAVAPWCRPEGVLASTLCCRDARKIVCKRPPKPRMMLYSPGAEKIGPLTLAASHA